MIRFSSMTMITLAITAMLLLPSVVLGQCTICANGTQSFNSDKFVPEFNSTCLEMELNVSFAGDEGQCALASQHAAWCECPGAEPTCTLCPNGSEPFYPNLEIPESDGITCRDFNYFAAIVPPDTPCDYFTDLSAFCGGCSVPAFSPGNDLADPNECSTLCPDGTNSPNPDTIISEEDDEITTCGQLEAFLTFSNPYDSCLFVWYLGVSKCGCDDTLPLVPEDAICTLCEDGSAPRNPSFEIVPDVTCRGLGYLISTNEENDCTLNQATAGAYCGCDNPVATQNACRICGDRLLPDTSRIADQVSQTLCGQLEFEANFGETICTEVQDIWASTCCSTDQESPSPIVLVAPTEAPSQTRVEDPTPTVLVAPTVAPSQTRVEDSTPIVLVAPSVAPSQTRVEDPTPTVLLSPTVAPSQTRVEDPTPTVLLSPTVVPSETRVEDPTPTEMVDPIVTPSKAQVEDQTSDARNISINLATAIFLAEFILFLMI